MSRVSDERLRALASFHVEDEALPCPLSTEETDALVDEIIDARAQLALADALADGLDNVGADHGCDDLLAAYRASRGGA